MAIAEHDRHELHQALREILPMNCADTLMHHIPFDGWDQFARVETIDVARADTNSKIAELRTELKTDISELKVEMHQGFAKNARWNAGFLITLIIGIIASVFR